MVGNPRVLGLLEEMLDTGKTPEEACRDCPELLSEVRNRWQEFQLIDAEVKSLLPGLVRNSEADTASPSRPAPSPPTAFGRYQVQRLLGGGGFGAVYLGHDAELDRLVAIKVLRRSQAAARPGRTGWRSRGASPSFVMLASLRSTTWACRRGKSTSSLTISKAPTLLGGCAIPPDLARGGPDRGGGGRRPAHAHSRLIIHRDVKPANILLTPRECRVLVDFGLALGETQAGALQRALSPVPRRTCHRSKRQARPTVSTAAPTFTAWAWSSTKCSPAACRSGRPTRWNCCGRCVTMSRNLPDSSSATSRPRWNGRASEALAERQEDRYTTAGDFAAVTPPGLLPTRAVAELTGPQSGWSASPPVSPVKRHTVGRQKELAELGRAFESAAAGQGLFLCVTGEPGIGKTTLVEDFHSELAAAGRVCALARGRVGAPRRDRGLFAVSRSFGEFAQRLLG